MRKEKILLVDDEPDIIDLISYNLEKEGYAIETATNGRDAIAIAKEFLPDLILLDVMMPEMDGMETCVEMRTTDSLKHTIIAFLTARGEDYSQIAGFDAGADDYIPKPIKPRVLISRIQALLRRKGNAAADEAATEINGLKIDKEKYLVTLNGNDMSLPKKEFELLALLLSKPGRVFTREEIFTAVWGDDVVGDRTIDVHIRKLREKLGNEHISTIKGVGYKIETR
ncbi:response regulator transcription factor [Cryomorpha ignava]|uniref:Phosphate regulon transcriptional regulatory protein PhoB n=1 Tax=Cryomorpha ignava TaxID=101383 RepID=A0A7K3WMS4_9FLAO|nr:response regulator transcription factor [Cryomorpha ignava]NEN22950.1 response regulator transcription factor [Cryomorpha ignava]